MNKLSKEDYNNEPVLYCSECLSLRIREIDETNFCDKCGSTSIKEAHISDWEHIYALKYGEKYLKLENNGRSKRNENCL